MCASVGLCSRNGRWVRDFEGGLLMMADMSASGVGRGSHSLPPHPLLCLPSPHASPALPPAHPPSLPALISSWPLSLHRSLSLSPPSFSRPRASLDSRAAWQERRRRSSLPAAVPEETGAVPISSEPTALSGARPLAYSSACV